MKNLIFITSRFPYEPGETFIEPEFPFLHSAFDRIIIITRNVKGDSIRPIPADVRVYRYNPTSALNDYLLMPWLILRNAGTFASLIREELLFRKKTGRRIGFYRKLVLLKTIIKSLQLRDFIAKIIEKEKPSGELVLYSYWMNSGARAICMLPQVNGIRIARAHRVDLYEEEAESGYIPLIRNTFTKLDALFFISEHGKDYFEKSFGLVHEKNIVSKLGITNSFTFKPEKSGNDTFTIISCSSLIKIKRVDLLIRALTKIRSSGKILWYHFGDGALRPELEQLASGLLGHRNNIEYHFRGYIPNSRLMEFYNANSVDLFINTSSSEGIPVSIMEARSFGIPVIATDAGGTCEILKSDTGTLLPVDFKIEMLIHAIEYYLLMDPSDMKSLRRKIYDNWNTNFNASNIYEKFIRKVNGILASQKIVSQ